MASVWVHEHRHTGQTIEDIQKDFVVCFGKEMAKSNVIGVGEKDFTTGSAKQWANFFQIAGLDVDQKNL